MIVDTDACPLCEFRPIQGLGVAGPRGSVPHMSHRAEAVTTLLPDGEMKQELWFVCERCGARWPHDDERGQRVEPWTPGARAS